MIQQQPNDPNQPGPPAGPPSEHVQEQPAGPLDPVPVGGAPPEDDLFVPRLGPAARSALVIVCGVATSLAALLGVFLLNVLADANIMGLYASYVIPAGALLVGLAASSGYALAAWFSGRRISGGLLLAIVSLQVAAYVAAQYVEFLASGPALSADGARELTFTEYFDLTTRSFAWKDRTGGGAGRPLGGLGYLLRAAEVLGFALGATLLPLALRGVPYCELCERYMKTRQLAVVPAEAAEADELTRLAGASDLDGFCAAVTRHQANKKANGKLPRRVRAELVRCVQCSGGHLRMTLEQGLGQNAKSAVVAQVPLHPEFIRQVVAARLA